MATKGAYLTRFEPGVSYVNIRDAPGGRVVGRLNDGRFVLITNEEETPAGAFQWVKVHLPAGPQSQPVSGYMALLTDVELIPANRFDMWRYTCGLFPGMQSGFCHSLMTNWAGGGEKIQVQTEPSKAIFYHVKGHEIGPPANYEAFGYDNDYIYRYWDTSPREAGQMYVNNPVISPGGQLLECRGVAWLFRFMRPGDRILLDLDIGWFHESTGRLVELKQKDQDGNDLAIPNPHGFDHIIELVAVHDDYDFPSGVTISDVIEIRSYWPDGKAFERYWYAAGRGLVGWQDEGKEPPLRSYIEITMIPGKHNRELLAWLPELPNPAGNPGSEDNPGGNEVPEYIEHTNMINPGFAGDPVATDYPRPNIAIETPQGWGIEARIGFDRYENNVAPNIIHKPGGGAWKFEPASSQMVATAYQGPSLLKAGYYQIDLSVWNHNAEAPVDQWRFGPYFNYDGSDWSHWDTPEIVPSFNLQDHNVVALGNNQARYWVHVPQDLEVDRLGFIFTTDWAKQTGSFEVGWADFYKVAYEAVDPGRLLLELRSDGAVRLTPSVDPDPDPDPQPDPDPDEPLAGIWSELTPQETNMVFAAQFYHDTPWGEPSDGWIRLTHKLLDYIARLESSD